MPLTFTRIFSPILVKREDDMAYPTLSQTRTRCIYFAIRTVVASQSVAIELILAIDLRLTMRHSCAEIISLNSIT